LFHKSLSLRISGHSHQGRPRCFREIASSPASFARSPAERAFGRQALEALWQRSLRGEDRDRTFRMLLANYLGAGRYNSALALMRTARTSGVRQDELDRWIVLSGIQPMFELADEKEQAAAASRLRIARVGDPRVARWLAVRWFRAK